MIFKSERDLCCFSHKYSLGIDAFLYLSVVVEDQYFLELLRQNKLYTARNLNMELLLS